MSGYASMRHARRAPKMVGEETPQLIIGGGDDDNDDPVLDPSSHRLSLTALDEY